MGLILRNMSASSGAPRVNLSGSLYFDHGSAAGAGGGGYIVMPEVSSVSTPAGNSGSLYVGAGAGSTSGLSTLYFKDDAGTATDIIAGAGLDGSGVAARLTKWTDGNTVTYSNIMEKVPGGTEVALSTYLNLTVSSSAGTAAFGDATATWDFDGSGAVSETGMTSLSATPSGAITLTAGAASVWSASAGDVTVDSTAGSLNLTGGEADAAAVRIQADNAAGGIDVDAGTAGVAIDTTGAFSVDGAAASNISVASGEADENLTVSVTGATASSLILSSAGTGTDAIDVNATAGGVDIDAAGAISLDSSGGSIDINIVDGQTVSVGLNGAVETVWTPHGTAGSEKWSTTNTSGTATDAIAITATAGGIDVGAGAVLALDGTTGIDIGKAADAAIDIDSTTLDIDSSGAITIDGTSTVSIDGGGATNLTTSSGALTLAGESLDVDATSGAFNIAGTAASTVTTSGGALSLDGQTGVNIQEDGTTVIEVTTARAVNIGVAGGNATTVKSTFNVDGAASFDSTVIVSGDLFVSGATTTVSSSNLIVKDPIAAFGIASSSVAGGSYTLGPVGDRGFAFPMDTAWAGSPVLYWDNSGAVSSGVPQGTFRAAYAVTSGSTDTITKAGALGLDCGALTTTTVTASGIVKTDDATEATTTTDGSLQTDGGLSVAKSAVIGDDLDLLSDSAIINVGSSEKWTATHANADNTLTVTADHRLAFGDAGDYIKGDGTDLSVISTGAVTVTAAAASTWSTSAGALTIDGAGGLTLDSDGTSAVNLGTEAAAKTITIGNDASTKVDIDALAIELDSAGTLVGTSVGATTLTAGAASTWSTSAGALTLTSAAAATWSTSAGALVIDGAAGLTLDSDGTDAVNLGTEAVAKTITIGNAASTKVDINALALDFDSAAATDILAASTLSAKGATGASFGDDTGTWEFDGSGAVTETGMTSLSATPSGAVTLTAGAASTWSTSAGALTLTSAAAASWGTAAGDLTLDCAADIVLDADGEHVYFKDGGTTSFAVEMTGSTATSLISQGNWRMEAGGDAYVISKGKDVYFSTGSSGPYLKTTMDFGHVTYDHQWKYKDFVWKVRAASGAFETFKIDGSPSVGSKADVVVGMSAGSAGMFALIPAKDNAFDLGGTSYRWRNVYTGDLHLANDRGNWTVVEESDMLTLRNNLTGKWYRMAMEEIDPTGRDEGMNGPPPVGGDPDWEL